MNVLAAPRAYVDRIVSDPNNPGMKVLLLDAETTKTVANVYSQTEILDRDVFLVERLDQHPQIDFHGRLHLCLLRRRSLCSQD